jgi:hypothetical protein
MRLSWADRFLFVEAMLRLFLARLLVVAFPFRILARRLGVHMRESASAHDASDDLLLHRVRWAIGAASRRAPWRCKCLEQGVAAKMMLRKRGVANTLYMGVARAGGAVEAHAWLRSGATYVTGGAGRERFSVVSTFADESVRAQ